ncbi:DUF2975 domain-containing protein [Rugamonas sp. FT82W]|uniref:DUF2975 domain-containing protein n=1 Tax=Duganella vulcania TaxID=2692166 RepID=A0A845GC24_9BURK|nr:DUF2975 domain-containing protein [Duganella vulcania]MYM90417.1 DUF2975 domain-containing protein [Duganella vulcania]
MKITLIRALLWLCVAAQAAFFVLAWTAYTPSIGSMTIDMTAIGMPFGARLALTPSARLLGAALALPTTLVLVYGLWRLDRLLLNFHRRELFSAQSIGHLRAFAGATLLSTALSIAEPPVRTLALRLAGDGGGQHFAVGVNSEQLMLILVCGMFYLITRLMQEGRRLREENEGFV